MEKEEASLFLFKLSYRLHGGKEKTVEHMNRPVLCPACGGIGYEPGRAETCACCKGAGIVPWRVAREYGKAKEAEEDTGAD